MAKAFQPTNRLRWLHVGAGQPPVLQQFWERVYVSRTGMEESDGEWFQIEYVFAREPCKHQEGGRCDHPYDSDCPRCMPQIVDGVCAICGQPHKAVDRHE